MALTSVNFSNPFSCPFERSQFTFLANLLFPSIIIATCLGIGPDLMTLLQNDLRYEVFLSSLNQDILPVPFFTRRRRTTKRTKKSHRPAGHECRKLNMCACALSALWLCMMSWQKRKSNAVCRHVTLWPLLLVKVRNIFLNFDYDMIALATGILFSHMP